jgi:hypothetical protein
MTDQLYQGFWTDLIAGELAAPDLRAFLFMSSFAADPDAVNLSDATLDEFDGVGYARVNCAGVTVAYDAGDEKVYIDFDDDSWGDPVAPGSEAPAGMGLYRYVDGTAANDVLHATITTGTFVNANNGSYALVLPATGLLFGQQVP